MKSWIILLMCLVAPAVFAQTDSVKLAVVRAETTGDEKMPDYLEAILPKGQRSETDKSEKIKFYPRSVPVELRGRKGALVWFSFTNPPKDKKTFYVEADQNVFGSILFGHKLYVCSLLSIQSSVPVINEFLATLNSDPLTEDEGRSMALLFAKCSGTLEIYGEGKSSEDVQKLMQKVAAPPVAAALNGGISVVFYSWSALPVSEVSKWTFHFQGKEIVSVTREPVSETGLHEQGQRPQESTLLHESGHVEPPKPR